VTDPVFRQARLAFLREGRIEPALLGFLRLVVERLIRYGGLPPMYSPTGRWDADAVEEVFADWLSARLIGTAQLAALLQQSNSAAAMARAAEAYLRRHLINRLERSYASNLYGRLRDMLPEDAQFTVIAAAAREQDQMWGLSSAEGLGPWQGSDEELVALAWSLGEFETIRYREDARKLSPVLERDELVRFVSGLLGAANAGLTLGQMVRVLVLRFDLEPATVESLGDEADEVEAPGTVIEEVEAAQLARAALGELTVRQVEVLREWLRGLSVRDIADGLQISTGTVSNEQAAISALLSRMSDPDGDSRAQLLNGLRDLLFIEDV
jgi:hypothetical protein